MPTEHVPVLAPELIALVDPGPGETVVDCTFGGGGHARLAAERIGPTGTLIAIDRDPAAAERFAELEPELVCERAVRAAATSPTCSRGCAADGVRPDVVLMDLGISSLQLDNWERGFSYSYDAPLDMRMDTDQPLSALEIVNEWPADAARDDDPRARRGALRALDRGRDRPPAPARDHLRAGRGDPGRGPAGVPLRPRPSGQAHLPGDPDRRQLRARLARPRPRRRLGDAGAGRPPGRDLVPLARGPAREALLRRARPRLRLPAASSRSASAATSPRRSCVSRRAVKPLGGRDRAQPALALGPPAGGPKARRRRKSPLRGRKPAGDDDGGDGDSENYGTGAARARRARAATRSARGAKPPQRRSPASSRSPRRPAPSAGSPTRGSSSGSAADGCGSALLGALLVGIVGLNVMAL